MQKQSKSNCEQISFIGISEEAVFALITVAVDTGIKSNVTISMYSMTDNWKMINLALK